MGTTDIARANAVRQTNSLLVTPQLSIGDQSCGVFVTGFCATTCAVAGLGVILAPGTYDLSKYSGIRFTYESEATIYVVLKSDTGNVIGYAKAPALAPTGAASATRTVLFSSLTPDANFSNLTQIEEVHCTIDDISKASGYSLGIHRLELLP